MSKLGSLKKRSILLFTMVFVLTMMLAPMSAAAQPGTYTDLSGHAARGIIQAMIDKGYVAGYEDGTFKPDQNITRAELMSVIERAFDSKIAAPAGLAGVEAMTWYVNAWADGDSANSEIADPEKPVTNEEAAAIFAHLKNLVADQAAANFFKDADSVSNWSQGAIGAVYKAGIMKGYADGTFQPGRSITRAEALTALQAALDYTVIKPLIVGNNYRPALSIAGIDTLGGSIVVFHSNVEGAEITWNGIPLEGITTVQGANAINVPALVPGEANTLSIKRPGSGKFTTSNIVWGEAGTPIVNGGFETGDFEGWQVVTGGLFPLVQSGTVSEGVYAAHLGDGADGMYPGRAAFISQAISVSEWGTPYLNLDYLVSGFDWGFDGMDIYIDGNPVAAFESEDSSGWQNGQYDLSAYAGQEVELIIESWTGDNLYPLYYFVDNISLTNGGVTGEALTPVNVSATPLKNGQALSDSVLSGTFLDQYGNEVSGTLSWLEAGESVNGSGYYVCIFTPDDGGQYLQMANTVQVDVANKVHNRMHTRKVPGSGYFR
ncbi:MAG: hypothetical protein GX133_00255 [Syntrophomonadaceae bacterium]|nr:hypothetical protein [Syntrophomonadaceae bacterium]